MNKHPYFLLGNSDIYHKALSEAIIEELKEIYPNLEFGYISTIKDVFKADIVIVSGGENISRNILWFISFLKKPLVLYHLLNNTKYFQQFPKKKKWIVTSKKNEDSYDYYPSPVFLSDLATSRRVNRIWSREKLVSKRGSIGIIGLDLEEALQKKLAAVLDLLVEDLDLNIIFTPVLEKDSRVMEEVLSQIKFSANTRYIRTERYCSSEVLGLIGKVDILITSDYHGAICAMSANRPVLGLNPDELLTELLTGVAQEEILLDINKLSDDEIYTRIKIAWVHKDAIIEQMQGRISELRAGAGEGIRQLGKRVLRGFE